MNPTPNTRHLLKPPYRADIDGLRALAVLAVVAYHAFPGAASGGFVGVDIFFVVSGFLITSIIAGSLERGAFTFREFYARRMRRIFPALVVVLAASLVLGWHVLIPVDYASLGRHVVAGVLFVANILLWQEANYFDAAAQFKPLLHLWSLGVEEQFYLLWPVLLLAARRARLDALHLTLALGAVSLAASLLLVSSAPSAAFYLPFTRFWELMLGALLSDGRVNRVMFRSTAPAGRRADGFALTGLALIAYAVVGLDDADPFPGWRALLPTCGTALLILAGPSTVVSRRLLSLRALVAIGLISYPLYLWHWPLLSFARVHAGDEVAPMARVLLVAASFGLAWATYALVETPFRFRLPRVLSVAALSLLMIAAGAAGWKVLHARGFGERAGEPVRLYANYSYAFRTASREGTCSIVDNAGPVTFPAACVDPPHADGRPLVVLWGDSHAAMLYPGLRAVADGRFRIAQFTRSGCRPFLQAGNERCLQGNAAVLRTIARERPEYVVMFALWNHRRFRSGEEMLRQLEPTITALKREGVPRIVVVGPAPRWKGTLPGNLVRMYRERPFLHVPQRARYGLSPDAIELDAYLQDQLGPRTDLIYFSALQTLCNARGCLTRIHDDPRILTTWDYGHLTRPAATHVAEQLAAEVGGFARAGAHRRSTDR